MNLSKLEIDIAKPDQITPAIDIATKNLIQAIVVPPEMVALGIMTRTIRQSNIKIITTVDSLKGIQYGKEKFRGMPVEAMSSNGFEILLTAGSQNQILDEMKYLTEFCKSYFGPLIETRFVLGFGMDNRTDVQFTNMINSCSKIILPTLVRTCFSSKIAPNKVFDTYNDQLKMIKAINNAIKIKVCGDVTPHIYREVRADKFAVTLAQVENLLRQEWAVEKPKAVAQG